MTPKEKAKEIISKFNFENLDNRYIIYQTVDESKRCALIAVDEILYSHYTILNGVKPTTHIYWEEVKQEIEKL